MLLEARRRGSPRQKSFLFPHPLATAVMAAVVVLSVAGCKTTGPETTGSIGAQGTPTSETDWHRLRDYWGQRYHANPGDADAAIAYARALRAMEQRAQAVA